MLCYQIQRVNTGKSIINVEISLVRNGYLPLIRSFTLSRVDDHKGILLWLILLSFNPIVGGPSCREKTGNFKVNFGGKKGFHGGSS